MRVIFHVDMNSFFASVEVAHDLSLKGKPVAIAGDEKERRGIIITCTYEAREKGVFTTMPVWQAKNLCPNLIIRKPSFPLYKEASEKIFTYLKQITPLVQKMSIDEGYLDVTDCGHFGTPLELAEKIQQDILSELDLPCSIGIAPNKFLAKMASGMKKPMGISVLRKREVPEKLWPLEVTAMHGVGKATARKLNELGIYTIEDIAKANAGLLKERLGVFGESIKERANGIDNRPVDPHKYDEHKSIGNSTTLAQDTIDEDFLMEKLFQLSRKVSERLKAQKYMTTNVQIAIKYDRQRMVTRSGKLPNPIDNHEDILRAAITLWRKHWSGEPVRLVGVAAQDLVDKQIAVKQLDLFSYEEDAKEEPILKVIEKLQDRFGEDVIRRG